MPLLKRKKKAELDVATAEEERREAEAAAEEAKSRAEEARSRAEEAKAIAAKARDEKEKAKIQAEAEELRARAEADKLAAEKLKSEKILSQAKLLELRKIDFETLERELLEWNASLEERERALQPEKTVADLSWAGGTEDSVIDEKGNVTKLAKEPYLAEKDRSLPKADRALAKTERLVDEAFVAGEAQSREKLVKSLEKLYIRALKDERITDADFYRKSILSISPDWKFAVPQENAPLGK